MKKTLPVKIPSFKNDEQIAAFMERHSGFDLLDAGLAEIVPSPPFVLQRKGRRALLKDKRVQIAFKDERSLRKTFSSFSAAHVFFVIDADLAGILLGLPDSPASESFYVPYLNISGVKLLDGSNEKAAFARSGRKAA